MDITNELFRKIHQKYKRLFLSRAYRLFHCEETAKDILQEAYINVAEKLKKDATVPTDEETLKRMVLWCISKRAIDEYRKEQKRPIILTSYNENKSEDPISRKVDKNSFHNYLHNGVKENTEKELDQILSSVELTEREQSVLKKYLDGLKIHQIAKDLNLEPKKVTNTKYKLLQKLKNAISASDQKKQIS